MEGDLRIVVKFRDYFICVDEVFRLLAWQWLELYADYPPHIGALRF